MSSHVATSFHKCCVKVQRFPSAPGSRGYDDNQNFGGGLDGVSCLVYWLLHTPPLWSSSTRHPGSDALIITLRTFFSSSSHFPARCLLLAAAGTPPVAQPSLHQGRADKIPLQKAETTHLCLTSAEVSMCNCSSMKKRFCKSLDH